MNEREQTQRVANPTGQAQVKHLVEEHHFTPMHAIQIVAELAEIREATTLHVTGLDLLINGDRFRAYPIT